MQFLRKNAKQYQIDPNHIGVIGGSAGGHLSAMVGLTGPDADLEPKGPYKGISSQVQAVMLHETLRKKGVESELVIIEGAKHSFHLQPEQQNLCGLVTGFLDEHLKNKKRT